jgi:xanthine dehydrogenase FAD-binding subunit
MIPRVEYLRPGALPEALELLRQYGGGMTILAGGTDVIPGMQQEDPRFVATRALLDLGALNELRDITADGMIGAAATFTDVVRSDIIRRKFPLLSAAAATVGSVQIRNRATVVGNFVNNAACADSVPPLLVYDAQVLLRSHAGERVLPLVDFLLAPNETARRPDELVTGVRLAAPPAGYVGRFYKLGRRRGIAISRITLAVLLESAGGRISGLRVAAGAVNPIGTRFPDLERTFVGQPATDQSWMELARQLGQAVIDRTGVRWSSAYKVPVLQQSLFGLLCDLNAEVRS